ncbi:HAD-IA family hydrolase, partial [Nonomuraea dietziae]|uniref:HAD-IA family hydrolase n=1 Tax=Nonomuraea dietziae TaxID=65515 RepID=UPI00343F4B68
RAWGGRRGLPGAAALRPARPPTVGGVVPAGTRGVAAARLRAAALPAPTLLLGAEDVPVGKPDPTGYLWAARLLGRGARHCLVVEDAEAGARAAGAAGMDCVGVGPALEGRRDLTVAHVPDLSHLRVSLEGDVLVVGVL